MHFGSTSATILLSILIILRWNSKEITARALNSRITIGDKLLTTTDELDSLNYRNKRQLAPYALTEIEDTLLPTSIQAKIKRDDGKEKKNSSGKTKEGGFFKTYGSDADGAKGYLKTSHGKGENGYKSLDTFHKLLGDRYGFEEHEAFDQDTDKKKEDKTGEKKHEKKHEQKRRNDHLGAGTSAEAAYYDDGGGTYVGFADGGEGNGSGEYYAEGDGEGDAYSGESGGGDDDGGNYSGESSYSGEGDDYY